MCIIFGLKTPFLFSFVNLARHTAVRLQQLHQSHGPTGLKNNRKRLSNQKYISYTKSKTEISDKCEISFKRSIAFEIT